MITPICPSSTPKLNEIRLIINAPSETPISFKIPAKQKHIKGFLLRKFCTEGTIVAAHKIY